MGTSRQRIAKAHAASKRRGYHSQAEVELHSVNAPGPGKHDAEICIGDCRAWLAKLNKERKLAGKVDLIFADPPFNWAVPYDRWQDQMPEKQYLKFTEEWLDGCVEALKPGGALWVNIPDDWAAEIVVHLKKRGMEMVNWCIWHYRFGQNNRARFISSKVHALYFIKPGGERTWNADKILEPSDRATTYGDPRTMSKKDGMPAGMRVPMDVWYGKYWGRIQGNNKERRSRHHNQLPEVYLARVVLACSNPDDLVIDPFLGSGTTGVIAQATNRRFIGIEFSPDNAESAKARIKAGPIRDPETPAEGNPIFERRKRGS